MNIVLPTLHVRPSAQAVPLAAACLAAALPEEMRKEARLLDLFPDQGDAQMLEKILSLEPDLVSFSLYAWNRSRILSLARILKEKHPAIFLVAGGPEATADPEGALLEGELDAVIRGEGELTFREMVHSLCRSETPAGLPGLTVRRGEEIEEGPQRPAAENLDALPSPWLSGVLSPAHGEGVLWEISRGCPFSCDFCFDARGGLGVRPISAERMEAELDLFVRSGVYQVWVLDSTFNHPPERGKALLRLLADRAPHIHFHLEAKADFLDRETARLLSRLPCSVQIGLQSARPEVLRNLRRSLDPKLFTQKMHMLSSEGVTFGLDLIYGLPGDDYRGFRHSLGAALNLGPNHVDIFPLAVLPGTALHRKGERYGIRAQDRPPYLILEHATFSAADMGQARKLAAATDLFYNLGRAVGFFPALLRATANDPAPFLEGFAAWTESRPEIGEAGLLETEKWEPKEVLRLQEGYVEHLLTKGGHAELLPAALDLLRYHYNYAETVLAEETLPAPPGSLTGIDRWETPCRIAPGMRLVPFAYEILDLLEMAEPDLERFTALFRPVGSTALFFRRGGEVFCESLEEGFLRLLEGCDGRKAPAEIFAGGIARSEGEEIVEFALAEGFLSPAEGWNRNEKG